MLACDGRLAWRFAEIAGVQFSSHARFFGRWYFAMQSFDVDPQENAFSSDTPAANCNGTQYVADALRSGTCPSEYWFDRSLPQDLQVVSREHWTPLIVALRVAKWLDDLGVRTVVDIGSGAGKFCVAAALACGCDFTGIEQRPRLVAAARQLARTFAVDDRVRFIEGTLGQCSIPEADAYYLFNPFGENLYPDARLDDAVELGDARYERDIALVEAFLEDVQVGTYVIKYNGFGGVMPRSFRPVRVDYELPNFLRLWRKVEDAGSTRAG